MAGAHMKDPPYLLQKPLLKMLSDGQEEKIISLNSEPISEFQSQVISFCSSIQFPNYPEYEMSCPVIYSHQRGKVLPQFRKYHLAKQLYSENINRTHSCFMIHRLISYTIVKIKKKEYYQIISEMVQNRWGSTFKGLIET